MTNAEQKRHPFLDDLDENVVLVSSILRSPVRGRDAVIKVVKAGAAQYLNQTPRFLDTLGDRSYFEYDAELKGGMIASGMVSMVRDAHGRVTQLHIAFSPLDAVQVMAQGVRERLGSEFEPSSVLSQGAQS